MALYWYFLFNLNYLIIGIISFSRETKCFSFSSLDFFYKNIEIHFILLFDPKILPGRCLTKIAPFLETNILLTALKEINGF